MHGSTNTAGMICPGRRRMILIGFGSLNHAPADPGQNGHPYFERFLQAFPTLESLAEAKIDRVLAAWTGLGYYARARNLHRTAVIIHQDLGGKFPNNQVAWAELPGVGPSTAAAITSICFNERVAILDGNVKRVLLGFAEPVGLAPVVSRATLGTRIVTA